MHNIITAIYIISSILFIVSLKSLSTQESAKHGVLYAILAMISALGATFLLVDFSTIDNPSYLLASVLIGIGVGIFLFVRVKMTQMPELIALLHSFVGLAAVLIGFVNFLSDNSFDSEGLKNIHNLELIVGVFIGAVTFGGSIIAFGKLKELLSSSPLVLPLKHIINIAFILFSMYFAYLFMFSSDSNLEYLIIVGALAFVFGLHLVASIGGADMPVVISMLNSYSGFAAAATGFMLNNDLLIIAGALVGSSGAILSYIMCKGMNRSFVSVILGGFGVKKADANSQNHSSQELEHTKITPSGVADILTNSKRVLITPGYGMATAKAQHSLANLYEILSKMGVELTFGVHPVAGRMPGHMNVLLAEANIPYDKVYEMDDINDDFENIDCVLVIGANDTVNPSAIDDKDSPIAGMPVLRVWEAKNVIVFKRSFASGYAGVENPLFFKNNTHMIFGDAKAMLDEIIKQF